MPTTLVILMMLPLRLRIMIRAASLQQSQQLRRLVAKTISKSSGFIIIMTLSRVMPALFTRMSKVPYRVLASLKSLVTWSALLTSACSAVASPLPAAIVATRSSAETALRL